MKTFLSPKLIYFQKPIQLLILMGLFLIIISSIFFEKNISITGPNAFVLGRTLIPYDLNLSPKGNCQIEQVFGRNIIVKKC